MVREMERFVLTFDLHFITPSRLFSDTALDALDEYIFCSISLAKMATFGSPDKYQARVEQFVKKAVGDMCRDDIESYFNEMKVLDAIKPETVQSVLMTSGVAAKKKTREKKDKIAFEIANNAKNVAFGRSDLLDGRVAPDNKKFKRVSGRCDVDTKQMKCRREKTCKFEHPWAESMRNMWGNGL